MSRTHIGIYAGTFNPIHAGHIAFAREAMRACGLDKVVFLPDPKPWNKQNVTDISHRFKLIELAIASTPQLQVLQMSSRRFRVKETLPRLQEMFPDAALTFLMGSDVAMSLRYWEDIKILLDGAEFAIGLRGNDTVDEINAAMEQLGREQASVVQYTLITTDAAHITSSQVRNDLSDAVHINSAMHAYIDQHGLYNKKDTS